MPNFVGKKVIFNTVSLSEQVQKALKEEILAGPLAPGQRIDLRAYAKLWNVSPTPLRDAIKQLETQGLVEVSPRRGVFVSKVDRQELKNIFEVRIALEGMAVELATPRIPLAKARETLALYRQAAATRTKKERERLLSKIDTLIHTQIINHCGNPRLIKAMDGIRDLIDWIARVQDARETALPEHIRIADAICNRDVVGAVAAMREHLQNSLARFDANWALPAAPGASKLRAKNSA
jgi:DNA-binding GntR family transcriptional regulator